ncbi:hypothetical protein Hdeb2414_s0004g00139991 [Helianthus debilis subsp. tardiflorus]
MFVECLDPKAAGAMVEAILAEGKPVWLDQIRDRFLHPTNDSFAAYANAILGDEGVDGLDDTVDPTREEKRAERDPDDDATLTEIMKKKKALEDKKKELDEQAAAALAAKKPKLQKETPPAPSESEIDLGVFTTKHGNLLEKIYVASGSQGVKSCKDPHKVDILKITPPTSPPSRTFDLSPPHVDRGKRKEADVEVEQVGEGGGDVDGEGDAGAGGDVGAGAGAGGDETTADCKWLLARAVPQIADRIAKSDELAKYMFELGQAAYNSGRKDGYGDGRAAVINNKKDYHFELFKEDCTAKYAAKRREYEFIEFGIVKAVEKLSRKANAIEVLKKDLGDQGTDGGDVGPSHQG